jgi:DNA-directed RNA polymerase specialized sigma24 family protein
MTSDLSPADLRILLDEADSAAHRLVRRLRLDRADIEDIRQDLILDALGRMKHFDADRGSLGAFLGIVMTNAAIRIAGRVKAHRGLFGTHPVSLDQILPDREGVCLGEMIADGEGLDQLYGASSAPIAVADHRIDLARHLAFLAPTDRGLCSELMRATVEDLAAAGRGARSSLYRRISAIRLDLTATGLRAA